MLHEIIGCCIFTYNVVLLSFILLQTSGFFNNYNLKKMDKFDKPLDNTEYCVHIGTHLGVSG